MKSTGNQVLVLIIGLLLGLIAGGGVVWYFLGNPGKNIIIVNQAPDQEKNDEKKKSSSDKKKAVKTKPVKEIVPEKQNIDLDSLDIENSEINGVDNETEGEELIADALAQDTLGNDTLEVDVFQEENIIVKKDELLFSKNMAITDLTKPELVNKKDSLLQILRGSKDPAPVNFIVVEYWKSPINYKGYKMGRNKIVLFGLPYFEKAQVYRLNNNLYFKNNDKFYKLQNSLEFKSFELVTDPNVLNQFAVK